MSNVVQCGAVTASVEDIATRGRCVHVWVKDHVGQRLGIWNIPVEFATDVAVAIQSLLPNVKDNRAGS